MAHHVVALGRQFGSGGREIGRIVSRELGFGYYDRELISMAAQRAEIREELFDGKDEKAANPWLFKGVYEGGPRVRQGQPAEDILFQMQSEVIRELSQKEDCVIVGRCAGDILAGSDVDLISLFICAPLQWRIAHRMEIEGTDQKTAAAAVDKIDKQRAKYFSHHTGHAWGIPENYDICINSSRLGIEETAAIISQHLRRIFGI